MVTKDSIIGQLVAENPEYIRTFFEHGMMCVGCPSAQGETIEQACAVHGMDCESLVDALNAVAAE